MEQKKKQTSEIRLIFMGTSAFAKEILYSLVKSGYAVAAVYAQPDKKVGRKQELISSPVKLLTSENSIPLFQSDKLNEAVTIKIKNLNPDLIIVAAYGKILPENILKIPRYGALNIHASLLPKYRGASPIQNALLNGDKKTGITIIRMDKNIDTGNIVSQKEIDISSDDTVEDLTAKLSALGSSLLIKTIPDYVAGRIKPKKQDNSKATFCRLIKRADGLVDWNDKAENIYNKFRAFRTWPGIFSFWEKKNKSVRLKLNKISLKKNGEESICPPGTVFSDKGNIVVQANPGIIILEEIQQEGKNPVSATEFINGHPSFIGSQFK